MTAGFSEVFWAGETLRLLSARALYWPEAQALILSDLHLGKDATFRNAGVPVPQGVTQADASRLESAVRSTDCRRVWILGDLLHARQGRDRGSLDPFLQWRRSRPDLEMMLVRGNHDLAAGDPPATWGIETVFPPYDVGPFRLCHEPLAGVGPSIAGHLHPAVRLRDRDGSSLRLPCFHWESAADRWVLPAFGGFTGGATVRQSVGDKVYAVTPDDAVIELPTPALGRRGRGAGCSSEVS